MGLAPRLDIRKEIQAKFTDAAEKPAAHALELAVQGSENMIIEKSSFEAVFFPFPRFSFLFSLLLILNIVLLVGYLGWLDSTGTSKPTKPWKEWEEGGGLSSLLSHIINLSY